MSFGASPSDIIIVVTFARRLYKQCKNAGGEYLEISREVRGLHTVLRHLKDEVEDPESVLNRDRSQYAKELAPVIGDCDYTLLQLDNLLQKYGRLGREKDGSGNRLWDKIRFGSAEMDELGSLRVKLINHKTSITVFLDTIQLHQSGRVSAALDIHGEKLDLILDKVDKVAARMASRLDGGRSVLTTYDDDDKEVWKQFRRELVQEGFSSDVLTQHKDVLRAYIRQIEQNGLLEEVAYPDMETGRDTRRWLESIPVQSPESEHPPPSFDAIHTNSEDTSAKELPVAEDNMKYPQSMKINITKGVKAAEGDASKQILRPPDASEATRREVDSDPTTGRLPMPYTTSRGPIDNEDPRAVAPRSLGIGSSICTTDNITSGGLDIPGGGRRGQQNLGIPSPSSSPSSYRSHASFDDGAIRSIPIRPRTQNQNLLPNAPQYETPPRSVPSALPPRPGTIQDDGGSRSPKATARLAPDQFGNEIPHDARWTRIRRSLISPVVLEQDGRRYEARPEFVAILGVLSRDEIEDLAARTHAHREERRARQAPVQPPRVPQRPIKQSDSETELSEDSSGRENRPRYEEHRSYPNRNVPRYTQPYSRSPNGTTTWPIPMPSPQLPYGHAPSVTWPLAPVTGAAQQGSRSGRGGSPPSSPPNYVSGGGPNYSEYNDGPRRNLSKVSEKNARAGGASNRNKPRNKWREGLTAAGIGGAAASLMNVLSEAAEGL